MIDIDKITAAIKEENKHYIGHYESGVFKNDTIGIALSDKENFIKYCDSLMNTNSYYGIYLRKARFYAVEEKYEEAIQVLDEGINTYHDESLDFAKAGIYEKLGDWQKAMDIYDNYIFTGSWEPGNPFCYYKAAYILKEYKKDLPASLKICEEYLEEYPVNGIADFERKSPLYYLIVEILFDLGKSEDAKKIISDLQKYDSQEKLLFEYMSIKKLEGEDAAEIFMKGTTESLLYPTTANEITYTKYLYDEGVYFSINPLAAGEYYVKKNVGALIEGYRNELSMYGILPVYEYGAKMPISLQHLDAAMFAWLHLDDSIRQIIRIEEDKATNKFWFEIYQHADRWYGAYEMIYRNIKLLAPYVEDCHFFIEENYGLRVDEYRVHNGRLYFTVGFATDEFVDEKNDYIEKRLLEQKDLPYINKYLSFNNLPWSSYDLERRQLKIEDKKKTAGQLDKALQFNPANAMAWYQKGLYHTLLKDTKEAEACFKKAIELDSDNIDFLISLIQNLIDSNVKDNWVHAEKYLDTAIELDPENKEVLYLAEDFYTKLNDRLKVAVYQQLLCELFKKNMAETSKDFSFTKINSYDKAAYENEISKIQQDDYDSQVKKASFLYHIEKWEDAESIYDKLIQRIPTADIPYIGKANLCWYTSSPPDYEKAIAYCDKALAVNPNSEYAWSTKGSALNNLGRYTEAVDCLKKALKINPKSWQANYSIACTYALMNDPAKAMQAIKAALAIDSSYQSKRKLYHGKDFKNLHDNIEFWKLVDPAY